jgi:hypothetical protein
VLDQDLDPAGGVAVYSADTATACPQTEAGRDDQVVWVQSQHLSSLLSAKQLSDCCRHNTGYYQKPLLLFLWFICKAIIVAQEQLINTDEEWVY